MRLGCPISMDFYGVDRSCLGAQRSERCRDTRMRRKQGESLISKVINAKMIAGEAEPVQGTRDHGRGQVLYFKGAGGG